MKTQKKSQNEYSFVEHLEELRRRIIWIIVIWVLISVIAYFFSSQILDFLVIPLKKYQKNVIFTRPLEPFFSILKICVFIGGIISIPHIIIQLYLFVSPALTEKERKVSKVISIFFSIFFFSGVIFTFYFIIPLGIKVLFSFGKGVLTPFVSIGYYLNFLLIFMILLGLVFNLPVFFSALAAIGLVKSNFLKQKRKYAIVGAFILSAIITPTTDIITQTFIAILLIFLYEISIIFVRIFET